MAQDNCIDTLNGASLSPSVTLSPTWRGWLLDGKRLMATQLKHAFTGVQTWVRRAKARRQLAELDARMLADVGLTREQALDEINKPFWRT